MIRTIEDGFEYQARQIFEGMLQEYEEDQKDRYELRACAQTFAVWLQGKQNYLGAAFYDAVDAYMGIEETTEGYNVEQ